jgi:SAM-dependent methyltransferase
MAAADVPAQAFDGAAAAAVETLFQGAGLDLQKLVRPALSILARRGVQKRLQQARDGDIARGIHDDDLNDPLLQALLARTVIANAAVEAILRRLRRLCLMGGGGLIQRLPGFATALAQQCFITDYAYDEGAEETAAVGDLSLEAEELLREGLGGEAPAEIFVAIAMYRSLGSLAGIEALAAGPELGALMRQQVTEPAEEAALAASVGSLAGAGSDAKSAVRQQYEEAPYPRWLSTDRKSPVPLAKAMAALFPGKRIALAASQEPEVLVAGCGTGKHAIDVAGQYLSAKVTAIDISRASLGYARRIAEQENIGNIDFLTADIMSLGPWQRRFDLIESAGVLHHLSDPEAGWRILCGLLAPHGLMKVAVYSALGRWDLRAARDFAAAGHGIVTPERIRRARADILALPAGDRRRRALQFSDFYSLRGCRDLLFNVQEREYDLKEIDAIMGRLDLDFIGFQFTDINTPARFKAAYPDAHLDDLTLWHAFELANQDTFSGMYQFWCRAKAPIGRDSSQN